MNIPIIGSLIYEEPGTGELILSFYTTSLDSDETAKHDYPQQPLQQVWSINYPFLAYKYMDPTNNKIVLMHLAQNIPQRLINLGTWEFVSFVNGGIDPNEISK